MFIPLTTELSMPTFIHPISPSRRGFTLVELLVVLGILVLLMALAVPLFGLLSGKRSIGSARNQVGAALAAARAQAIAQQEVRGVLFVVDPASQRINGILVRATEEHPGDATFAQQSDAQVFLDAVDADPIVLPVGVALATTCDYTLPINQVHSDDRYVGFNVLASGAFNTIPVGGVILFDSHGQLTSLRYAFRFQFNNAQNQPVHTTLGDILFPTTNGAKLPRYVDSPLSYTGDDRQMPQGQPFGLAPHSSLGLVLLDGADFLPFSSTYPPQTHWSLAGPKFTNGLPWSVKPPPKYPQVDPVTGKPIDFGEFGKEQWIDEHAIPYLINRYTGALIQGE
jgi:prepilin-type N-terminal cleavage/methylation domain-containing protein